MRKDKFCDILIGSTTFIAGDNKNAGKTTFLNYILKQVRLQVSPVFLTIGIDGETKDQIFGTPKPRIMTEPGDYIITSDSMIERSEASFEILEVFPDRTVLGRLVLAKTLRGGFIELVGAEDNSGLSDMIEYVKEELDMHTIIVDGAVNRVTQIASTKDAGFVYVSKINQANLKSSLEKMRIISLVKDFQPENEMAAKENAFYLKGALTESKLESIPKECENLIIDDFTKIFLKYHQIAKLCREKNIYFKYPYKLQYFVVNLMDITKEEFEVLIKENSIDGRIIYNPYQYEN